MSIETVKAEGYTQAVTLCNHTYDLELLVQPDVDFDSRFRAYDIDNKEWLWVNGWLFEVVQ